MPITLDVTPARLRRRYLTLRKIGAIAVSHGPYTCTRVPITGAVMIERGGPMIDADERLFFPLGAVVGINDVVRCVETNQTWSVAYVQDWPEHLEAFVKRAGAAVGGNK